MGRELQKKKNRSGNPKVTQRSSKKPNGKAVILNNALIAANWDKKQTLAQNYARLGLARKLNGSTGGVEVRAGVGAKATGAGVGKVDALDIRRVKRGREGEVGGRAFEKGVGVGEVRIVRDDEGRIVRVLDGEGEGEEANRQSQGHKAHWAGALHDPLRALESDDSSEEDMDDDDDNDGNDQEDEFTSFSDDDDESKDIAHDRNGHLQHLPSIIGSATTPSTDEPPHSLITQLTAAAAIPGAKKPRKQSEREADWCQALVEKHGRDYGAMARDTKLNIMQQSVGDLKRRVDKYLKSVKSSD